MKRPFFIAVGILVFMLAAALLYFRGREYHVIITQSEINHVLRTQFPVSKTHLLIFRITYSNPQLKLLPESDRLEVGLDAELNINIRGESKNLGGTVLVTTGLTYRQETKQFFLSEPEINHLSFQGIPQQHVDKVTAFASNVARDYLQEFPVYTLQARGAKTATARLLLKDVQVKSSEIHVTLGL